MNRYIFIGLLCFVIGACTHHTTGFYEGPRYLSFVNEKGADTAFISFANYPAGIGHTVQTRHRRDNDDIPTSRKQGSGGP